MTEVKFTPETWLTAANELLKEAEGFQQQAAATLSSASSIDQLGAAQGMSMADVALATVLPPVFEQLGEQIVQLADGLAAESEAMEDSGRAYQEIEEANTALAQEVL